MTEEHSTTVEPPKEEAAVTDAARTDSAVVAKVRQWLNDQGAPLEMRCAHAFHASGAEVLQSGYYLSPQGKSREIDITAHLTTSWFVQPRNGQELREPRVSRMVLDLCCVVECKSGPLSQKPWIVFSSDRTLFPAKTRFHRLGTPCARRALVEASLDRETHELALFQLGQRIGYSLACAFKSETKNADTYDPAFSALSSVVAAAVSKAEPEQGDTKWPEYISRLVFPVLVVDTPLVECWLDEAGEMQLQECERARILWRNPAFDRSAVIVDVVHERALRTLIGEVKAALERIDNYQLLLEDMAHGMFEDLDVGQRQTSTESNR